MAEGTDRNEKIEGLIEDTELDGLLDDALLDYDAPSKPIIKPEQPPAVPPVPQMDQKDMDELGSMMQGILGTDLMKEYEMFSKELGQHMPDMFDFQGLEGDLFGPGATKPVPPPGDIHASTEDTIQDLHKNLENAKSAQPPGLEQGGEQMLGMVQELMGDLLSREVLYEPMKDLCDQYPKYLDEEDLSVEERQRYSRQLVVMQEICREFDSESCKDSQQTKHDRQCRTLKLVQGLQELGNPPTGIVDTPVLPDLMQLTQNDSNMCGQQ